MLKRRKFCINVINICCFFYSIAGNFRAEVCGLSLGTGLYFAWFW